MRFEKMILITALLLATEFAFSASVSQIETAKKAAFALLERSAAEREKEIQKENPGVRLSSVDIREENPPLRYEVTELKKCGDIVRVSVRANLFVYHPSGKAEYLEKGFYRYLVDVKGEDQVLGIEHNYFNGKMSYDPVQFFRSNKMSSEPGSMPEMLRLCPDQK